MLRLPFTILVLLLAFAAAAQGATPYRWRHVRIGGGGYVSGIVFHPHESGLYYARTDIGGAYRWDGGKGRWVALTDWLGAADDNLMGIESIALDPADPDRLYLAAGTYTTARSGHAAILRSHDRGAHFQRVDLPFRLGANELGRGNGERMAVDPHDGRIVLLGTPADGLWRSDDHGAHWRRVDSFPAVATAPASTAQNRWRRQPIGIVFVVFDAASGKPGVPTPIVYAGVSTRGTSLYRSDDGGAHWHAVPGQPKGLRPTHMRADGPGRWLLVYDDEPGPDVTHDGEIRRFEPASGRWTDISPLPRPAQGPRGYGWGDVGVDPHDPQVLIASTFGHYHPHDLLFRSVDGGAHWKEVFTRSRFERDNAVWTREHVPHWMSTVAVDPFDSDHVLFVTGYGIWASRDMRRFDAGGTVHWRFQDEGLEETVPLGLISPPVGAHLLSAVGDLDGYRHDDLRRAPLQFAAPPRYANGESIDFAARKPAIVVRSGREREAPFEVRAAWSQDGGRTWRAFASEPGDGNGEGDIAVGAAGHQVLWFPVRARTAYVTDDWGRHWTAAAGLPATATQVLADRVDPRRFYAFDASNDTVYASRDGGRHFAPLGGAFARLARTVGGRAHLQAVPGVAGALYLGGSGGLIRGRADGRASTRVKAVDAADAFGFGKPAPGRSTPALYLSGRVGGRAGLFRSVDAGAHWRRIDDDAHRYGRILEVTGDPRVFGRVYLGTSGRGIVYGDPAGIPP